MALAPDFRRIVAEHCISRGKGSVALTKFGKFGEIRDSHLFLGNSWKFGTEIRKFGTVTYFLTCCGAVRHDGRHAASCTGGGAGVAASSHAAGEQSPGRFLCR